MKVQIGFLSLLFNYHSLSDIAVKKRVLKVNLEELKKQIKSFD